MYISWVTKTAESLEFLEALVAHDNRMLFTNQSLQQIITYLWAIARPYFIWRVFTPFLVLGYIPVHLVAVTDIFAKWPAAYWVTEALGSLLLGLYFLFKALAEYHEMLQKGSDYFKDWYNYVELLVQTLILTFFGLTVRTWIEDDDAATASLK